MASNSSNLTRNGLTIPALASVTQIAAYSTVYGLISLTALVGNVLVCYVIIRNPDMRTVPNAFLLNLAVADLLFTVITVPPLLGMQISPQYWVFGEIMCKTVPFLNSVTLMASIYTMVALAFDRYNAICHPFRARRHHTMRRTLVAIALIWALSAAVCSPMIPIQFLRDFAASLYCAEDWTKYGGDSVKKIYYVVQFVIFFAIPIVIITVAYTAIMRQMGHSAALSEKVRAGSVGRSKVSRSKRKTTLMMLVVIIVFLICMLPFNIFLIIVTFLSRRYISRNMKAITFAGNILKVLVVCASACNPIIYNFFSYKFKMAFANVFRCRESRSKEPLKRIGMTSTVLDVKL